MSIDLGAEPSMYLEDHYLSGLSHCLNAQSIAAVVRSEPFRLGRSAKSVVRLKYIRYKPRRRCLALHCMSATDKPAMDSPAAGPGDFLLAKALTKAGFAKQHQSLQQSSADRHLWLADPLRQIIYLRFPLDQRLRAVQKVYDPAAHNRVLRRVVGGEHGWHLQAMWPLAYKPERRFVVGVQDCAGDQWLVKFHAVERFADAVCRLQLLAQSGLVSPQLMHVCERYHAVCLEYLPGTCLTQLIACDRGHYEEAALAGMKLAQLHQQPMAGAWLRLPQSRHERLGDLADSLRVLSPELGVRTTAIVSRVLHHLKSTRGDTAICHGDFYAKQVLVDQADVRFIDFDQAGPGDRYGDVANFVAQLHWRELAGDFGTDSRVAVSEAFLDGYRQSHRQFNELRFRAQLAAALLRCAMHPFRNAMPDWQMGVEVLLAKACAVLDWDQPTRLR
jgi:aminoglycoside phosphotransferase